MIRDSFNAALSEIPYEQRGPLVDTLDSAGLVLKWLSDRGLAAEPYLVVGLTALILEERQRVRKRSDG